MGKVKQIWLPLAFLASFGAVGVFYWMIPYNQVNLPDSLMVPGMIVVGFAALALCSFRIAPFWRVTGIVGASVPAAVFARVLWDCAQDPTSHNLWPFEVVIALLVGLAVAFAGALAGGLIARWFP